MSDLYQRADSAAQFILSQTSLRPRIGLILGSGLGAFADSLADAIRVPYSQIPSFPRSTAIGHAGQMVIGNADAIPVAAMQGRVHLYEGYSAEEVAFPIRVFGRMGVRAVILTNAAGGINLKYQQGALVLIKDHINLQGDNPLVGPNDDRLGVRFPDMTHAYTRAYGKSRPGRSGQTRSVTGRRRLRSAARARAMRRRQKFVTCERLEQTWSACLPLPKSSRPATWGSKFSPSPASPTWPPEFWIKLCLIRKSWRRARKSVDSSRRSCAPCSRESQPMWRNEY